MEGLGGARGREELAFLSGGVGEEWMDEWS